ncbi:MAG: hypothetical protein WB973_22770 [Thermoanaerobaculia bacterium]
MRERRSSSGAPQLFFTEKDVEDICEEALRAQGYYPASPQRVNIDRFVEKRFNVSPQFEHMHPGVLGYSKFGPKGMVSMHISEALVSDANLAAERRVSTTLAHEAGHGLMHAQLFVLPDYDSTLFGHNEDVEGQKILCRDEKTVERRKYDGRWWELQANMAIGPLLMPKKLVHDSLRPFLLSRGTFGIEEIDPKRREEAARHLATTFDVNPAVARIRIEKLYKPAGPQLTL